MQKNFFLTNQNWGGYNFICFEISFVLGKNLEEETQMKNTEENITIEWEVEEIEDESRVTAMFCFKNCDVNAN